MVDVTPVKQFMWEAFNVDPTQFWTAIAGGIMVAAIIFFFIKLVLDKILHGEEMEHNSLSTGVSLVIAIAAMIYTWHSGIWLLFASSVWLIAGLGVLIIIGVLYKALRKHVWTSERKGKRELKNREIRESKRELKEAREEGELEEEKVLEEELQKDYNRYYALMQRIQRTKQKMDKLSNEIISRIEKGEEITPELAESVNEVLQEAMEEIEELEKLLSEEKYEVKEGKDIDKKLLKEVKKLRKEVGKTVDEMKKSVEELRSLPKLIEQHNNIIREQSKIKNIQNEKEREKEQKKAESKLRKIGKSLKEHTVSVGKHFENALSLMSYTMRLDRAALFFVSKKYWYHATRLQMTYNRLKEINASLDDIRKEVEGIFEVDDKGNISKIEMDKIAAESQKIISLIGDMESTINKVYGSYKFIDPKFIEKMIEEPKRVKDASKTLKSLHGCLNTLKKAQTNYNKIKDIKVLLNALKSCTPTLYAFYRANRFLVAEIYAALIKVSK